MTVVFEGFFKRKIQKFDYPSQLTTVRSWLLLETRKSSSLLLERRKISHSKRFFKVEILVKFFLNFIMYKTPTAGRALQPADL